MPPIQPSLRGSLLTGASALALSVSWSGAFAQSPTGRSNPATLPTWTVWGEGAVFWTRGGSFNIPSIPGFGSPFTALTPGAGAEGAFGFDYRWPDPVWHFVFDFRYGRTRTGSANSSSSSTSTSTAHHTFPSTTFGHVPSFGVVPTSTVTTTTSNSTATQASGWESHLVADFMVGRDIGMGMGMGKSEFEFGIRVADLYAAAHAAEAINSKTTTTAKDTFYCGTNGHGAPVLCTSNTATSASSSASAFASWNSRFFGVGPRLAVTQDVPLVGFWSFDYEAGIAALFGPRSFNGNGATSAGFSFSQNLNSTIGVFNADAWAAISYLFAPNVKVNVGLRGDYYDGALLTYNINTGGLQSLSRLYWGPFVRLTGTW